MRPNGVRGKLPKPLKLRADVISSFDRRWPDFSVRDFLIECWRKADNFKQPPAITETAGTVKAVVNHGRWIVRCPNKPIGCGGAMYASLAEPVFLCADCFSPENGGKWYAVAFPANRVGIEAVLLKRPAVLAESASNRNWEPSEGVADLRRENTEHGVGV